MAAPKNSFSSEYWNLHRNSLLFSSALFIVSISSKRGTFSIFGMAFEQVSVRAFAFLLLCAATYAILAFVLEWQAECWPNVKLEQSKLRDAHRVIHESTAKMTVSIESIEETIGLYKNVKGPNINGELPFTAAVIGEGVSNTLQKMQQSEVRALREQPAHHSCSENELNQMAHNNIGAAVAFVEIFQSDVFQRQIREHQAFHDKAQRLEKMLGGIKHDVEQARAALNRVPLQLITPFSLEMGRIVVVAALLPVSVYAVATAHAVGQLGFHWFSSPLVNWLRGLG